VYPPPEIVTVPVGVLPPLVDDATVTVTLRELLALRLVWAGVTVTVAVARTAVTVTVAVPVDVA